MSAHTSSESRAPYRLARHDLGTTGDGARICVEPMTADVAAAMGPALVAIDPWLTYAMSAAAMTRSLAQVDEGAPRFQIQCDETAAGVLVVRPRWLHGPYLVLFGVLPRFQGRGVGALALAWLEREARRSEQRNLWLCVSAFNSAAQGFYAEHGFTMQTTITALARDGIDEVLMRKSLHPVSAPPSVASEGSPRP